VVWRIGKLAAPRVARVTRYDDPMVAWNRLDIIDAKVIVEIRVTEPMGAGTVSQFDRAGARRGKSQGS
jgi:hypothetical protein